MRKFIQQLSPMDRWAIILLILGLVALYCCFSLADSLGAGKGVERWDVKTLTDGFPPGTPVASTIHAERLLKAPVKWGEHLARQPLEKVTVQISGEIVACGVESDEDYHLDFSDGTETEVAEIPNPKMNPKYAKEWQTCREWVAEHVGFTPGKIRMLKTPVHCTITGIRFFDKKLHGKGGSVNGVEIHPVVSIHG